MYKIKLTKSGTVRSKGTVPIWDVSSTVLSWLNPAKKTQTALSARNCGATARLSSIAIKSAQIKKNKKQKTENRKHSGPIGLNLENVHCVNPTLTRQELSPTKMCPAAYLETRQVSAPDSVTMEMEKLGRSQKTRAVTETAVRDYCPSIMFARSAAGRPPELTPSLT